MILRYFLRTFYLITCNLLAVNGVRSDFLTHQTMRFFNTVRNDFLIYGITQDCQLYFVEHMNYMLIKSLKVDRSNTYCYPDLVKLHLRQGIKQISLLLIMKQAMNHICTLPIEMPSLQTVSNGQLFSYSIFTSLPYAACSRLRDNNFLLEPDLSFMDTTFSDIIYFINAKSIGFQRDIQQFRINEYGNLVAMEKFVVYHPQKGSHGGIEQFNQFIVELDLKRSILYTFNRLQKNLLSECLFDLLFRPSYRFPKWIEFNHVQRKQAWLESFAVDGQLMMFTESIHDEMGATSELYLKNLRIRNSSTRLLHLDFVGDIGVLQKQTYADLSTKNISTFDNVRQLYAQSARNAQLAISHASQKNTVLDIISPATLTVKTTSTSTAASVEKATINGIDQFYSEIESDQSSGIIDHKIWKGTKTPATERSSTLSYQQWFTKDVSKDHDMEESEKKLAENTEEMRNIILPSSNDSKIFWESNISKVDKSKENIMLDIDDHIYDNEMGNVQGTKKENEVFQFPEIIPEKDIITSATVGHSEMTTQPSTTLRSNCTLTVMQLNVFICLLASFHIYLNFSIP
ncbi:unnamed protein product [Onchocerca ochengi]|uniref:Integrase catalytic domain-containing protein n=1 Tax=Onchocerca ochengi TaxID=42157 RepID=A0A182DX84_ONCOC|nr:unnamed protein product [Onchocerca ochengi]